MKNKFGLFFGKYKLDTLAYLCSILVSIILLLYIYRPFNLYQLMSGYNGDGLIFYTFVKGVIENGAFWENKYLGAPHNLNFYDFPLSELLNYWLIRFCSLFSSNFIVVANSYNLLCYILSTISALFVFKRNKISNSISFVGSILFSFSYYHISRAIGHAFLANIFIIPLSIYIILYVLNFKESIFRKVKKLIILLLICLLIASSGIYYALFTLFFLFIVLINHIYIFNKVKFWNTIYLFFTIITGVIINLWPSILYQLKYSKILVERSPWESEMFGLRIIQILLPSIEHRITYLKDLANNYQSIVGVESFNSSLGLIGSIGFIGLILYGLFSKNKERQIVISQISNLNIAAILLATIGGFSSYIAFVFGFTYIRAYNRISIFIMFLSLFFLMFKLNDLKIKIKKIYFYFILLIILIIGLLDQFPEKSRNKMNFNYLNDKKIVETIEANMPINSMILQLPIMKFPESGSINKMYDYDHFKVYLWSKNIKWSYGAPKNRGVDNWHSSLSQLSYNQMLKQIIYIGYNGVWINCDGYIDSGKQIVDSLSSIINYPPIRNGNIVFWNLEEYKNTIKNEIGIVEFNKKSSITLANLNLNISLNRNFYNKEFNGSNYFNWCDSVGIVTLANHSSVPKRVTFYTKFVTPGDLNSKIYIESNMFKDTVTMSNNQNSIEYRKDFTLPVGHVKLKITTSSKKFESPSETRNLFFGIHDYLLKIK